MSITSNIAGFHVQMVRKIADENNLTGFDRDKHFLMFGNALANAAKEIVTIDDFYEFVEKYKKFNQLD